MDTPELSTTSVDRKLKTVLIGLESRGVPILPERWYTAHSEADATAMAAGDHEKREYLTTNAHLPLLIGHDGRLHPSWEVTATSGRVAALRPAVQTIPKGPLRSAIGDGRRVVLCLDWRASHPTILAVLSGDDTLAVDCEEGTLYETVADLAGCTVPEAKLCLLKMMNGGAPNVEAVRGIFEAGGRYAVAGEWLRHTVNSARATGKVSVGGRMFPLSDPSKCHTAISAVLQRVEAEALIHAAHALHSFAGAELVMLVHDEIVLMVDPDAASIRAAWEKGVDAMEEGMRAAGVDACPQVTSRIGWTWGEASEAAPPSSCPHAPAMPRTAWATRGLDAVRAGKLSTPGDVFGLMVASIDKAPDLRVALAESTAGADFRRKVSSYTALARERGRGITENTTTGPARFLIGSQVELSLSLHEHLTAGETDEAVYDGTGFYRVVDGLWADMQEAELSCIVQGWDGLRVGASGEKPKQLRLSAGDVAGVVSLLKDRITSPTHFAEQTGGVVFRSRLLLADGRVRPVFAADRIRQREALPLDYDREATCPRWEQFLKEVWRDQPDIESRIAYLQEWIGAALWGDATRYRGSPVLTGDGNNGKSVLINTIQSLFPPEAQSTVDLAKLGGQKGEYYAMSLYGKRLNAVSDLPRHHVEDTGTFKSAVMGEPITGRDPAGKPITFAPRAAWIISLNVPPAVSDASRGFWSRVKVLSFDRIFVQGKDMDPHLKERLEAERVGIILWALKGLRRLRAQGGYTDPASSAAHVADWRASSDSVMAYIAAWMECEGAETVKIPAQALYDHYAAWCAEQGLSRPVSSIVFGRRLTQHSRGGWGTFIAKLPKSSKTQRVQLVPHLELRP